MIRRPLLMQLVEGEVFVEFGPTEVEGERKEEYVVVLGSAGLQGDKLAARLVAEEEGRGPV